RDLGVGLRIDDTRVSRRHCLIERKGAGWVVHDLNSHNGTSVGNQRVTNHALRDGEVIEVGHATLVFHDAADEADKPEPISRRPPPAAPRGPTPPPPRRASGPQHPPARTLPPRPRSLWRRCPRHAAFSVAFAPRRVVSLDCSAPRKLIPDGSTGTASPSTSPA